VKIFVLRSTNNSSEIFEELFIKLKIYLNYYSPDQPAAQTGTEIPFPAPVASDFLV